MSSFDQMRDRDFIAWCRRWEAEHPQHLLTGREQYRLHELSGSKYWLSSIPACDMAELRLDLKEERERCATIADTVSCVFAGPSLHTEGFELAKSTIARQIRAGAMPRKDRASDPPSRRMDDEAVPGGRFGDGDYI